MRLLPQENTTLLTCHFIKLKKKYLRNLINLILL